jgi:hypothetical protein
MRLVVGFGLANYRIGLLLPPLVVSSSIFLILWGSTIAGSDIIASSFVPYVLLGISIPFSFLCVIAEATLSTNILRYGRIRLKDLGYSVSGKWSSFLVVTLVYLGLLVSARWFYSSFVSVPLTIAIVNMSTLPADSISWFFASSTDPWQFILNFPDLFNLGNTRSGWVSNVFLTVPIAVFYWFALTAVASDGHDALRAMRDAVRMARNQLTHVIVYALIVGLIFTLADAVPISQTVFLGLRWFASGFGWLIVPKIAMLLALSVYAVKVAFAPLLFLWASAIYESSRSKTR